ncbi:MAG: ATP-binding protein [Methanoregulaceae archaeon]|nr:ATP-binding protein [Methanoregulaceae archaeon]
MNFREWFSSSGAKWDLAIIGSSAGTLLLNLAGLLTGITAVFPHLLYLPVVTAAYRYPKRGALCAAVLAGLYFIMAVVFSGGSPMTILEALVRACILVAIGWIIALLSRRLREREDLYEGLFAHSEAGSLLLTWSGTGLVVGQANWKAASLLGMSPADLAGLPVTTFWAEKEMESIVSKLKGDGAVYTTDTVFTRPDSKSINVIASIASIPDNRAILTFVDITRRVRAEEASGVAHTKLNLLSRISADHFHLGIDRILETVEDLTATTQDPGVLLHADRIRVLAWNLARQLLLAESYRELGTTPPAWLGVQRILERSARTLNITRDASLRFWVERLEIYADPLFGDVLTHLLENSLRHGKGLTEIIITYHEGGDGLDLVLEDNGGGIPASKKHQIFEYDSGGHAGIGLFICRQILAVTGIAISETGREGTGARFVLHFPEGRYRIEGRDDESPPFPLPSDAEKPWVRGFPHKTGAIVQELLSEEFPLADILWIDYHQTKGDPKIDRIFAAFADGEMVSLARCRKHPDGYAVDGVFTPVNKRGHGYANAVVWGLVEACGHETLYMHAVKNLTTFYSHFGFSPIGEHELPPTIRERYAWAGGQMEGADVCPMKRNADP